MKAKRWGKVYVRGLKNECHDGRESNPQPLGHEVTSPTTNFHLLLDRPLSVPEKDHLGEGDLPAAASVVKKRLQPDGHRVVDHLEAVGFKSFKEAVS